MEQAERQAPRVFISYAHESEAHREWVLHFAQRLRREGVDAWIDRFMPHQSDWSTWAERQIQSADFVLCLCTRLWRHRFDLVEDEGSDWGVRHEARVIRACLQRARGPDHKFVPLVLSQADAHCHVPPTFGTPTVYVLDRDYTRLFQHLTGVVEYSPAALGAGRPEAAVGWDGGRRALGSWTVRERLGRGGFGEVYAAWDDRGRHGALKRFVPPPNSSRAERRERFLRGAATLELLQRAGGHENLVRIVDSPQEVEGELFYVMERIHGPNLRRLGRNELLKRPLAERLGWFRQIGEALRYAHGATSAGVFHRDLKPDNVLLDQNTQPWTAVVADLDLALEENLETLTRGVGLLGTRTFVPPEQWDALSEEDSFEWQRPDPMVRDLWALGMVLQFLVVGATHDDSRYREKQLEQALQGARDAGALKRFLGALLHPEPSERPVDMTQVLYELEGVEAALRIRRARGRPRREVLPKAVLEADARFHEVWCNLNASVHLNPTNVAEARRAFERGAHAPPFTYRPYDIADEVLTRLDQVGPPRDHPLGAMLAELVELTHLSVLALRDRTAERFDALARAEDWYPDDALLSLSFPQGQPAREPAALDVASATAHLRDALQSRRMWLWRVVTNPVMSARMAVDGAIRTISVHPGAWFRPRDLDRLVVGLVDVNARRAENGTAQPLRCFQTGLPRALLTDEGLKLIAEERTGLSTPGALSRQLAVARAAQLARTLGFRELYRELLSSMSPALAWGICQRLKRGLGDPALPGVYAKDVVYLKGRMKVQEWLAAGGDVAWLYVGKVGLEQPVADWMSDGWVKPQPVPALWRQSADGPDTRG